MAITSRAPRETVQIRNPDFPGPEYNLQPSIRLVRPSAAPFGSTGQRSSLARAAGPAPGQYEVQASPIRGRSFSAKPTPFMSASKRFGGATSSVPGPGTYSAAGSIRMHQVARPRTTSAAGGGGGGAAAGAGRGRGRGPEAERLRWRRAPTAPSVPSRHSAFGYEEAQDGTLVLQEAPPERRPREHGPGPTAYAAHAEWGGPSSRAGTAYGRDRSTRTDLARPPGAIDTPGPGSYALPGLAASASARPGVTVSGPGGAVFDRGVPADARSAAFRSGTAKGEALRNRATDFVPGPGAHYNPSAMSSLRTKRRLPPAQQHFGSTTTRSPLGSTANTPGPIYNLPGSVQLRGTAARHDGLPSSSGPQRRSAVAAGRSRGGHGAASPKRGFAVSDVRFRDPTAAAAAGVPGVGHYETEDGFKAKMPAYNARVVGTMTTGKRSELGGGSTVKSADGQYVPVPGPGQYRPGDYASLHREIDDARPHAMFSSAVRRPSPGSSRPGRIDESPDEEAAALQADYRSRLGPGSYDVTTRWRAHSSFSRAAHEGRGLVASGPERFAGAGFAGDAAGSAPPSLGPGSYEVAGAVPRGGRASSAARGSSPSRLSRSARFASRPSELPGPGQYQTRPGWSTRSYNVTVAEQELLRAAKGF
ncbi:hypothetical protein FNF27_01827 [Cafeteria roenbergensis]|uniref:Sperm-tail PG-rich repeat-containing protein 2 n=1 Tax=Cafeteria roenbergensis TaxID=33653 RepID=A0A5A8EFB5_CAFRO|nr:hypothetical protein FNF27_01827 [Cafeteria roenbergensis]